MKLLESELLINPNRADFQVRLAFYRAEAGRQDFEPPLKRAVELAPEDRELRVTAAEAYAAAGDRARAIEFARSALARGLTLKTIERSYHLRDMLAEIQPASPGTNLK